MNSYLIGLFTKIISLIMISIMSLFNSVSYKMDTKEVVNNDASKSLNVINKVINYTTTVDKTKMKNVNQDFYSSLHRAIEYAKADFINT